MRAIIIDDEQSGIDTLSVIIEMHIKEVKVVAASTHAEKGIELIENYKPEIVFLDVNMPQMDGFQLLERLNWKGFNLIFVTAHQEFALKAIKNNALDYLLKPIDYEELLKTIERIKSKEARSEEKFNYGELQDIVQHSLKQRILINLRSGMEYVNLSDIVYLESQSNYTKIYLTDSRELLTAKGLKEFEAQLCNPELPFMRVHHSFMVNLQHVSKYITANESIVMKDDCEVPLAKSKKDLFLTWLKE